MVLNMLKKVGMLMGKNIGGYIMADFTKSRIFKFILVTEDKDKETLLKNGLKMVQQFDNCGKKNYLFLNNPSLLQTFNTDNMNMFFTNRILF